MWLYTVVNHGLFSVLTGCPIVKAGAVFFASCIFTTCVYRYVIYATNTCFVENTSSGFSFLHLFLLLRLSVFTLRPGRWFCSLKRLPSSVSVSCSVDAHSWCFGPLHCRLLTFLTVCLCVCCRKPHGIPEQTERLL